MSTQEQDKVRELPLKANDGVLDDGETDEPAGEARRIDYEQTYRDGHGWVQTHGSVSDRNRSRPTKDGFSEGCGND